MTKNSYTAEELYSQIKQLTDQAIELESAITIARGYVRH